MEEVNIF